MRSSKSTSTGPDVVEVAQRENPGFECEVADLRELPFEDASLAGVVCWFSLIYLARVLQQRLRLVPLTLYAGDHAAWKSAAA